MTWDTTFLFLNCSPEGSKDGRRELLVILCCPSLQVVKAHSLGQHSARVDWLLELSWLWGEGRKLSAGSGLPPIPLVWALIYLILLKTFLELLPFSLFFEAQENPCCFLFCVFIHCV